MAVSDPATNPVNSLNVVALIEAIPGNNILVRADPPAYTVAAVSSAYARLAGKTTADIRDSSFFDSFPAQGDSTNDLRASFGKAIEEKEPNEIVLHPHNGDTAYRKATSTPLLNEHGDVSFVLHSISDVPGLAMNELSEREQTLELAMEIGELGIYRIDLETDTAHYSQRVMDWFGFDRRQVPLTEVFPQIHENDRARVEQAFRGSLLGEQGGRHDLTYRVAGPDAPVRYLRSLGQVQLHEGRPVSVSGMIQDVTEQVQTQQRIEEMVADRTRELREAHESLSRANDKQQEIINVFHTPLQVLEPLFENGAIVDFRYKLTNKAYAAYADTTPDKIQDKRVGEVFPGYFQTDSFTKVARTFETGISDTWEIHYDLDGLDLYNEMSATRMGGEVVVHFTDFTKLKNLQLDLMRKIEELERSNQHLEEFAHAASHDLKEPIRKIQVFTALLKDQLSSRLQETELQTFNRIENATSRMGLLVDDLLLYSHVSQHPLEMELVDLNKKLQRVLEDLELYIAEKGAEINIGPLPEVRGYRRQLQQMFQNLISNALKYSREGVRPRVDISARLEAIDGQPCHIIEVRDNGIGFEQKYADKIFQMFARLHGKHEYSGTGIGLSIVKKVVETHGGKISATGVPGVGAVFTIHLPV